uniref:tRNA-synt_2 domain-containing protein n=1 Tax=Macrostomum lignano TaxID=282301 RepID=A0A1I8HF68_9PLAT
TINLHGFRIAAAGRGGGLGPARAAHPPAGRPAAVRCLRPSRPLYAAFLLLLQLRRLRRNKDGKAEQAGMGVASRNSPAEMERPQQLPDDRKHPNAVDAVYFNGADQLGNNLIMAASRRQRNLLQCLSILRLRGVGLLEHPSHPDTNFTATEGGGFSKSDMRIECLEPMQTWRLEFDGEMTLLPEAEAEKRRRQLGTTGGGCGRRVRVRAQLTWRALHRQFDFDTDQDSHPLAEAVASEEWSQEMFKRLESVHQTHYEQFGEITGPVYVDDEKVADLKLQGARDHSYGNHRVWSDLYRYGLQYIYLQDRTCIAIGCVSMPNYLSKPSTDFRIRCLAGGRAYTVQCRAADQAVFCMGTAAEVRIYERFCDFEVNGIRGWGVSEWCYRSSEPWPAWEHAEQSAA